MFGIFRFIYFLCEVFMVPDKNKYQGNYMDNQEKHYFAAFFYEFCQLRSVKFAMFEIYYLTGIFKINYWVVRNRQSLSFKNLPFNLRLIGVSSSSRSCREAFIENFIS